MVLDLEKCSVKCNLGLNETKTEIMSSNSDLGIKIVNSKGFALEVLSGFIFLLLISCQSLTISMN